MNPDKNKHSVPSVDTYAYYSAEGKRLLADGLSIADLIQFFRSKGLSKVSSMRALRDASGISLNEAKALVHNSAAWNSRKENDEQFQEDLWQTVDVLAKDRKIKVTQGTDRQKKLSARLTA